MNNTFSDSSPDIGTASLLGVVEKLPFPIACSFQKMNEAKEPSLKLQYLFETYENTIIYLSTLFLSMYYRGVVPPNSTILPLAEKLDFTELEDWLNFLTAACQDPRAQEFKVLSDIQQWFQSLESEQVYLQELKNYSKQEKALGHLQNLFQIRSSLFHIFPMLLEDECQNYLRYCWISLETMLQKLEFLASYSIYYIELCNPQNQEIIAKKISGSKAPFKRVSLKVQKQLPNHQIFLIDKSVGAFYPLYPFFVYQECYHSIREENEDTWEFFWFVGASGEKMLYQGGSYMVAMREHTAAYREIQARWQKELATKNKEIKSFTDIWEIAFQETDQTLSHLKSTTVKGDYHPRFEAERVIQNFIEQENTPFFLLTGAKGVGKTTLLAKMARNWSNHGEVVFFLSVRGKNGDDLSRYMTNIFGSEESWLQARAITNVAKQKWVIILDGVDNCLDPKNLFANLDNFTRRNADFLKVIVSLPDMSMVAWESYIPKEIAMKNDGICPIVESAQPFYTLKPFELGELKTVYACAVKKVPFPTPSFSSIPEKIHSMLRYPALMHIFFYCLRGSEVPRYLRIRDLLEGFVMNHVNSSKTKRKYMDEVVEIAANISKNYISTKGICESNNLDQIYHKFSMNIPSGRKEARYEGIICDQFSLGEDNFPERIITFNISIIRDYLLYRSFALAGKHDDRQLVGYLSKLGEGELQYWGILYFGLLRLLEKQYFERFLVISKSDNFSGRVVSQLLSEILIMREMSSSQQIFFDEMMNSFIQNLISVGTKEISAAVHQLAIFLYNNERPEAAGFIWETLVTNVSVGNLPTETETIQLLTGYSFQKYGDLSKANKIYKKVVKSIRKKDGFPKEFAHYLLLGKAFCEAGELDKAEEYLRKAHEKIFLEKHRVEVYEIFGKVCQQRGDFSRASEFFEKQRNLAEKLGYRSSTVRSFQNLGELFLESGDIDQGTKKIQEAKDIAEDICDEKLVTLCCISLGLAYKEGSNFQQAILTLVDCLENRAHFFSKKTLAHIHLVLSQIYEGQLKFNLASEHIRDAMTIARSLDDKQGSASCYQQMAIIEIGQGNFTQAKEFIDRAMKMFQEQGDKAGLANLYLRLGDIYQKLEQGTQAYDAYNESKKLYNAIKNRRGSAEVHNNIAVLLARGKKFDRARSELKTSYEFNQEIQNKRGLAENKNTEAFIYHLEGENSKALEGYIECAKLFEDMNEKKNLGAIYNRIGLIHKNRGNFYDALSFLQKSLEIQEFIGDVVGLAASYNNIGLIYDAKNDYEKALEFYEKDLAITEKLGDKRGLATSYHNIAILHYNHKNYARALWCLDHCVQIYQELDDKEMLSKLQDRIQHVKNKL